MAQSVFNTFSLIFTFVVQSVAVNLVGCGPDKPLVVQENTQNYTIVCEDILSDNDVRWVLTRTISNRTGNNIGYCPGDSSVCSGGNPFISFSRPNRNVSIVQIAKVNRSDLSEANITCSGISQTGELVVINSSCDMDIIYKADVSSCNIEAVQSESTWKLRGLCNITKVFSTFNRYACRLWQNQSSSLGKEVANVTYSPTLDTNNPPYAHGSCSYSLPLPLDNDNYSFTVTVSPGDTTKSAGAITVAKPLQAPIINCLMSTFPYVREQGDLNCTCTASDLGMPGGRLIAYYGDQRLNVNNFGDKYLNFGKRSLSRADNGTSVKCILDWATEDTDDMNTNFTLRIAYGPEEVTVSGPSVFDINPSQIQNINLTCNASIVSPFVNYSWTGCPSGVSMSHICSARPDPSDASYSVQCTASNPLSQVTKTANHTVELNYPPTKPPVISLEPPLSLSDPIYQGDKFTVTCTVNGGKPVSATTVSFTCPHMADTSDITGTAEVNSSLRFDSVSSDNHGNCTCSAVWKNTTWYTHRAVWSLIVYSPPSTPFIFPFINSTGTPTYPFLAGTSGTLQCRSNQTGYPAATYSWAAPSSGHASGSNLTFFSLSKEENKKTVMCTASNSYTEHRGPVDNATFVLQVYYKPEILFTSDPNATDCLEVSTSSYFTRCVVAEGNKVHLHCAADSNPAPASFMWRGNGVYTNTSELVIPSANHTIHNGDYNCSVITKQENNDRRLPLASSAILRIIVGYSPRLLTFGINSQDNETVYVNEKSTVEMKCVCNGRPLPKLRLINATLPEQYLNQSQPEGDIYDDEETGEVSLIINPVPCEASGNYRCDVNNSLGQNSQSRILLVLCAPRRSYTAEETVNTTDGKGELSFRMTAYPTPEVKNVSYLGHDLQADYSGRPVTNNTIQCNCSASLWSPAAVTCKIIVVILTENDEGFYRIVFNNTLGEISFTFFAKGNLAKPSEGPEPNIPAIIGGIIAAVIGISILIAAVVFLRRWIGKDKHKNRRAKEHVKIMENKDTEDEANMTVNELYGRSSDLAINSSTASRNGHEEYEAVSIEASSKPSKADSALAKTDNVKTSGKGKEASVGKNAQTNKKKKALLSMSPLEGSVYENVAFEASETGDNCDNFEEKKKPDREVQRNKDGLIYLTLAFDNTKGIKPPPPKREETEYVSIDLHKTALHPNAINES